MTMAPQGVAMKRSALVKMNAAREELARILCEEATHEALAPHFDPDRLTMPDRLVRLRKSLRRLIDTLDGRTR